MHTENCLKSLDLPPEAKEIVIKNIPITDYLLAKIKKFPLPPNYIPLQIEIRFDDVLHHKIDRGTTTYVRQTTDEPMFMEWRFDDECALFQLGQTVLVNRVEKIQGIEELNRYISNNNGRNNLP